MRVAVSAAHAVTHTDAKRELQGRGKPQIDDAAARDEARSWPLFASRRGTGLALGSIGGARDISVATKSRSTTGKHSP